MKRYHLLRNFRKLVKQAILFLESSIVLILNTFNHYFGIIDESLLQYDQYKPIFRTSGRF